MKPLTRLTRRALHPAHRSALWLAGRKGGAVVVRVSPLPKGTVSERVAARLVEAGWADQHGDTLITTTLGRRKLGAPLPPKAATYLRQRWGTTQAPGSKVPGEPELVDVAELHPDWRNRAEAHRKLSRADLDAARLSGLDHPEERLRELRLMAAEKGQDVSDELRFVNRGLRALERKVRGEAA